MTNEEKMDEIFNETNEFFKKKVREAFGLGEQAKIVDICDGSITDIYDVLNDCFFDEDDETCKTCSGFKLCQKMEELGYDEWNELDYEEPNGYLDEMETTTAVSKDGIFW